MDLSEALVERLRAFATESEETADETRQEDLGSIIEHMRALAGQAASLPPPGPNAALAALESELKALASDNASAIGRELEARVKPARGEATLPAPANPAMGSMIHRLMAAIARAHALRANVAAAVSGAEEISRAEELTVLSRAQALLEDGVTRLKYGGEQRSRPLLN